MTSEPNSLIYFGTDESSLADRQFSAGKLTLAISDGAVRHLSWHGVEVIRGIACPVRDANWATHASVLDDESITETADEFEITQVRLVADGALRIALVFNGSSDGTFRATAEISASRDFVTNRAGFTLLHPLRDVAGTPLRVTHPDGSVTSSQFPLLIMPDQVAGDIAGLRHSVGGIDTDITFWGEVFEMEDQRNWSDASFKTYCRPLSLPRPYRLDAGAILRQEIHVRVQGAPTGKAPDANKLASAVLELKAGTETVPHLAVTMEDSAIPEHRVHRLCRLLKPAILQLRVTPQTAPAMCDSAKSTAVSPAEIELEIVVPSTDDPQTALTRIAAACKNASLAVARVLALPENYLHSYQSVGPWPAGPRPQDLWQDVRASFPDAEIGGGVLTYFPELNRCRPDRCDYVTHGSTAITHAADDVSVMESLEGLSHVFSSARALAEGRDYRLGLTAIGMRSNPYGTGVVENLQQCRVAMAGADPRQRGLFAAAWAVGAMAATGGHNVSSMALSAFVGPFGVIFRSEAWAQPLYGEGADRVYPLFHVVRFLAGMGGAARLSLSVMDKRVVGVAAKENSRTRMVLANLGTDISHVRLPQRAEIRILNADSFRAATRSPEWLDESDARQCSDVALAPLNVAFLTMAR